MKFSIIDAGLLPACISAGDEKNEYYFALRFAIFVSGYKEMKTLLSKILLLLIRQAKICINPYKILPVIIRYFKITLASKILIYGAGWNKKLLTRVGKMKQIVLKADNREEEFNKDKLNTSLLKAGASAEHSASAADEIERQFKNFMNSDDIYNQALGHIKKRDPMAALKYTLKKAIMNLGPAGFVFEKYAAKILEQNGYKTEMPPLPLSGFCVDHEVDIIAEKDDEHFMVECKYHNIHGNQSDIKTALYVNSRFLDLKKGWDNKNNNKAKNGSSENKSNTSNNIPDDKYYNGQENQYYNIIGNTYYFTGAWLFTNTRCTSDAVKYANCSGMKITGWNYPENESLQFYIESKKIYPVTILSTLSKNHKEKLFENNILTIKELISFQIEDLMELLSLDHDYAAKILDEISLLSS